jgi:hypothetical protein
MYANVLRAGTLSDLRVVRRVSTSFVPTHFNNNDPTRDRNDPSAILWHAILKQKDLQGQGIWIVAPDGTVIGGMSAEVDGHPADRIGNGPGAPWQSNPRFADAAVELLDKTLAKFGSVSQRSAKPQPLPYRGAGIKPDGSVRLIAYNKADGGLAFSVPLSQDDWQAFVPAKAEVGEKWTLPDPVAGAFAPVLSPYADTRFRPRPCDLKSAELTAQIESIENHVARIRLAGRWRADWKHDDNEHSIGNATAQGIAIYDLSKKSVRSLLMVFDGTYSYTTNHIKVHKPLTSAAVVRWRLDGEAE